MTAGAAWLAPGSGSRQHLVECAVAYREELVARHKGPVPGRPPTQAEIDANRRFWLAREWFEQAIAALPRQDRVARRLSDQWLELSGWVFGARHLGLQTTEDVAWSFLRRLATGDCPDSAPREVLRSAKAVPGEWLFDWRDNLRAVTDIVRSAWTITPAGDRYSARRRGW